eukprot:gene14307-20288_t
MSSFLPPPLQLISNLGGMAEPFQRITALIAKPCLSKIELNNFEKEAFQWKQGDIERLIDQDIIDTCSSVVSDDLNPSSKWEIVFRVLLQLGSNEDARTLAREELVPKLSKALLTGLKIAKGDKQIGHLLTKGRALGALCYDEELSHLDWVSQLSAYCKESLDRAMGARGAFTESYVVLSVILGVARSTRMTTLSSHITALLLQSGALGLLHKLSERLLESELTGIPKVVAKQGRLMIDVIVAEQGLLMMMMDTIVAEQALMMMDVVHSELPEAYLEEIGAVSLAKRLVQVAHKCNWYVVKATVFSCRSLEPTFFSEPASMDMLHHIFASKSASLRVKALAFVSMLPSAIFTTFADDFNAAILSVVSIPPRTLKAVMTEVGRSVWSTPFPLNKEAKLALQNSDLLLIIGQIIPASCPPCLVELMPDEIKLAVIGHLGYDPETEEELVAGWGEDANEKNNKQRGVKNAVAEWEGSPSKSGDDAHRSASAERSESRSIGHQEAVHANVTLKHEPDISAPPLPVAKSGSGRPLIKTFKLVTGGSKPITNRASSRSPDLPADIPLDPGKPEPLGSKKAGHAGLKADAAAPAPASHAAKTPTGPRQPQLSTLSSLESDVKLLLGLNAAHSVSQPLPVEELRQAYFEAEDEEAVAVPDLNGDSFPLPVEELRQAYFEAEDEEAIAVPDLNGDSFPREEGTSVPESSKEGTEQPCAWLEQAKIKYASDKEEGREKRVPKFKVKKSIVEAAQAQTQAALALQQLQQQSPPSAAPGDAAAASSAMPPPPPALSKSAQKSPSAARETYVPNRLPDKLAHASASLAVPPGGSNGSSGAAAPSSSGWAGRSNGQEEHQKVVLRRNPATTSRGLAISRQKRMRENPYAPQGMGEAGPQALDRYGMGEAGPQALDRYASRHVNKRPAMFAPVNNSYGPLAGPSRSISLNPGSLAASPAASASQSAVGVPDLGGQEAASHGRSQQQQEAASPNHGRSQQQQVQPPLQQVANNSAIIFSKADVQEGAIVFSKADVQEVNSIVDDLYTRIDTFDGRGNKVISHLAKGTAYLASIVFLKHIMGLGHSLSSYGSTGNSTPSPQPRPFCAGRGQPGVHSVPQAQHGPRPFTIFLWIHWELNPLPTAPPFLCRGAANLASIVYLKYSMDLGQAVDLDRQLMSIKKRALNVYRGLSSGQDLDLLVNMSEMVSQESGVVRRDVEQMLGRAQQ